MREILFRGKRVDNGKWVEGDLMQYSDSTAIWGEHRNDIVHTDTVSQFIGLCDKNGNRIYEGDIICQKVIFTNGRAGVRAVLIGFDCGAFSYVDLRVKNWAMRNPIAICDNMDGIVTNEWGIIGNKWDNPELLNK